MNIEYPEDISELTRLVQEKEDVTITINIGRHDPTHSGYYCRIGSDDDSWAKSGHGFTLEEALKQGLRIFLKKKKESREEESEKFRRTFNSTASIEDLL